MKYFIFNVLIAVLMINCKSAPSKKYLIEEAIVAALEDIHTNSPFCNLIPFPIDTLGNYETVIDNEDYKRVVYFRTTSGLESNEEPDRLKVFLKEATHSNKDSFQQLREIYIGESKDQKYIILDSFDVVNTFPKERNKFLRTSENYGVFVISNPLYTESQDGLVIMAFNVYYFCGKLCYCERAYVLKLNPISNEWDVLFKENLKPNLIN